METTLREDSGGEEDDSEGDSMIAAADTVVLKENLGEITSSGSPTIHTPHHQSALPFLPQNQERKRHLSPLYASPAESPSPRGGSVAKQPSRGGAAHKGRAVEKKSPSKGSGPSSGARGSGPTASIPPRLGTGGGVERGGAEVESTEDEWGQASRKKDQEGTWRWRGLE